MCTSSPTRMPSWRRCAYHVTKVPVPPPLRPCIKLVRARNRGLLLPPQTTRQQELKPHAFWKNRRVRARACVRVCVCVCVYARMREWLYGCVCQCLCVQSLGCMRMHGSCKRHQVNGAPVPNKYCHLIRRSFKTGSESELRLLGSDCYRSWARR